MTTWTTQDLDRIGSAHEVDVITRRADGRARTPVTIWAVRVADDLYARSWRGASAAWYRAALARPAGWIRAGGIDTAVSFGAPPDGVEDAVDAAYRAKYADSSYAEAMVAAPARATTLRLLPPSAGPPA